MSEPVSERTIGVIVGSNSSTSINRRLALAITALELGAGTAVPTVRMFSERQPGTLIRINLREAEVPRHHAGALSLPLRASEAMAGIVAAL